MRDPIPRPETFRSRLRGPELTARIGLWLGISFGIAFLTGVISHVAQDTPGWLTFPTRPVSLYRVTQGLHVIAGTVAVPLLLVKLWSVYPKLFERPDWRSLRAGTGPPRPRRRVRRTSPRATRSLAQAVDAS